MADFLNGQQRVVQFFSSHSDEGIGISIISYAELYEGVLRSPRRVERLSQLERFVDTLDVFPVDSNVARRFAEIRTELRQRGEPIPDLDTLIGATALSQDLPILTRDQHFSRVKGLQVISGAL
jgi:tRNA(fMet)-specific endonuclease VapC